MFSPRLALTLIGCCVLFVSILNAFLAVRHVSFSSLSMSNQDEDYTLYITWKNDFGNGDSSIDKTEKAKEILSTGTATASGDGNLRSTHRQDAHHQDDPKEVKQSTDTVTKDKDIVTDVIKHLERMTPKDADAPPTTVDNKSNIIGDSGNSTVFTRHDNVVIVTKIHGAHQWSLLVQSMCLLHYAYNSKVLYDIVVFSTDPVPNEDILSIQAMLHPVKFTLVVDNRGLQTEIASLPPAKYEAFLKMCNVTNPTNLTWFSNCDGNRLAYNWQAEFRSVHLWHHPVMAEYKTMVWLDTDGFATRAWEKDPVDYFIKNDGVIMFDHFPMGASRYWVQERFNTAWNKTLCKLELSKETGNFVSELGTGRKCSTRGIPNIHGFFHITNIDFYRSKIVTDGLHTILGDCFLCRFPDDQLAVTAPAAILAPERSWEMRSKGFHLDVFHNHKLDGIDQAKPAGFKQYWVKVGKKTLPSAAWVCKVTEAG